MVKLCEFGIEYHNYKVIGLVGRQHGCVNVSTDNAKWFMDNTIRGDIVTVKNTVGGPLSGLDGLGDWQFSWEEWKADELY